MKLHNRFKLIAASIVLLLIMASCNSSTDKTINKPAKDSADKNQNIAKSITAEKPKTDYQRPPIINIVDTLTPKRVIAYSNDSAAAYEGIGAKLGKIYGSKIQEYIKKNSLKQSGAPIAWYKTQKAPYFFEAGIPINKKGGKSVPGVKVRDLAAGKAIVAHFYGPFTMLPQGYDAIKEWIKDNKKKPAGAPYEIYQTDPYDKDGKPVDPYKIQTDIVFPIK